MNSIDALRRIDDRLVKDGVAAVLAGLPPGGDLHRVVSAAAHLLGPVDPPAALTDILLSRLATDPGLRDLAAAYAGTIAPRPRLERLGAAPDGPHPALRRVLRDLDGARILALSADGTWLVTGDRGGDAVVRDAATGAVRHRLLGEYGRVDAVAVAPDQRWIATGDGYAVCVWDAATGARQALLSVPGTDPAEHMLLRGVAILPGGDRLVCAGGDGRVRVWDTATWRLRRTGAESDVTRSVVAGADGTWFVTTDSFGKAWLCDAATAGPRQPLTARGHGIRSVASAPGGDRLVTGGDDGTVRLWTVPTAGSAGSAGSARVALVLRGHTGDVDAVAVAPDGTWLASAGDDGAVRLWDAATGRQFGAIADQDHVWGLAFTTDGGRLVSAGTELRFWDTAVLRAGGGAATRTPVSGPVPGPDGRWLAGVAGGGVRIWDTAGGTLRRTLRGPGRDEVGAVAVAPDGTWTAGTGTHRVFVWETGTGVVRHVLDGGLNAAHGLAIAPDGGWLAVAARESVSVWDPATGRRRWSRAVPGPGGVRGPAVAPDGTWLATIEGEHLRIRDPATGAPLFEVTGPGRWPAALAITPDGRRIAVAPRHPASLWVLDTGTGAVTGPIPAGRLQGLAFTADGAWLAGWEQDGAVTVWRTPDEPADWAAAAAMRVDDTVTGACWLPGATLCLGGAKGLHRFRLTS